MYVSGLAQVVLIVCGGCYWAHLEYKGNYDKHFKRRGQEVLDQIKQIEKSERNGTASAAQPKDMIRVELFDNVTDTASSKNFSLVLSRRSVCPTLSSSFIKRIAKGDEIRKKLEGIACDVYDGLVIGGVGNSSPTKKCMTNVSASSPLLLNSSNGGMKEPLLINPHYSQFSYPNDEKCPENFSMWTNQVELSGGQSGGDSKPQNTSIEIEATQIAAKYIQVCYQCAGLSQILFILEDNQIVGYKGEYRRMWSYGDSMTVADMDVFAVRAKSPWQIVMDTESELKYYGTRYMDDRYKGQKEYARTLFYSGLAVMGVGGASELANRFGSKKSSSPSSSSSQSSTTSLNKSSHSSETTNGERPIRDETSNVTVPPNSHDGGVL